jgi:hypothetical protein
MSWFDKHTHRWVLVGKTYAKPAILNVEAHDLMGLSGETQDAISRLARGRTTFLWKCEDVECDAFRDHILVGEEVKCE